MKYYAKAFMTTQLHTHIYQKAENVPSTQNMWLQRLFILKEKKIELSSNNTLISHVRSDMFIYSN